MKDESGGNVEWRERERETISKDLRERKKGLAAVDQSSR